MSIVVNLLGRPSLEDPTGLAYRFRSQKSWGLLAYLLLTERAPSRAHLAELMFNAADDPLRALRWSLAEIRRGLGCQLEGDPVILTLAPGTTVDVHVLAHGNWADAVDLPGLGHELLELLTPRGAAGFEAWLLSERRRVAAAAEAILHEAALGSLSEGDLGAALGFAERAAAMSPYDENSQALVIRIHRRMGNGRLAEQQYAAFARTLAADLGTSPGAVVESAMREGETPAPTQVTRAAVNAILEAGAAAVAAGAVPAGVDSLQTAVLLADRTDDAGLQVSSRLVLAEALVHSIRGLDEEGLAALHAADRIARSIPDRASMAEVRTELGYVDFLRARYDRAEYWLNEALAHADGSLRVTAKVNAYLGSVDSDRADYGRALDRLRAGADVSRSLGDLRRQAYATSMIGRIDLLRGALPDAIERLREAIALAEADRWLAFLPWPQALLGEAELAAGRPDAAADLLDQAFARACQLGDPCWEGISARGLALVAESSGDVEGAFSMLADATIRNNRWADAYVWLDAYILDAQCALGIRHGHPDTADWIESMQKLASRTDMRELVVRALLHGAALGDGQAAAGAVLLAEGIENDALTARVSELAPG